MPPGTFLDAHRYATSNSVYFVAVEGDGFVKQANTTLEKRANAVGAH
jgi:hypothetical protein